MCNGMIISNICRDTLTHRNLFKDDGRHSKDTDDLSQGPIKGGEDSRAQRIRVGKESSPKDKLCEAINTWRTHTHTQKASFQRGETDERSYCQNITTSFGKVYFLFLALAKSKFFELRDTKHTQGFHTWQNPKEIIRYSTARRKQIK